MKQPTEGRSRLSKPTMGANRFPWRNMKTFDSLRNPVYRLYYSGLLGQMAAINMHWIANSLLIYRITGSATILGLTAIISAIPQFGLGLFGGTAADRMQKKYILLVGQGGSGAVALGIAFALATGYISVERAGSWWVLLVGAVVQGGITSLTMPSRQAIIYELVSGEQLMNAVALNNLGMNVFRLLGPAIAGFLIDLFDFGAVYFTMTGLYLVAIVFTIFLPKTSKISPASGNHLADIGAGLKYIRYEPTILLLVLFSLLTILLSVPYMTLLPIFTDDILDVGAKGMGILTSVSGIGAMVSSLALASLPNKRRGSMLLVSGLVLGLALASFSFSRSWYLSLAFIVFVGMGQAGRMTLGNSLLLHYVQNEYRGRVISILQMEWALSSFSGLLAALLVGVVGVQWAVGGFALLLALLSLLTFVFVARLRKLE